MHARARAHTHTHTHTYACLHTDFRRSTYAHETEFAHTETHTHTHTAKDKFQQIGSRVGKQARVLRKFSSEDLLPEYFLAGPGSGPFSMRAETHAQCKTNAPIHAHSFSDL